MKKNHQALTSVVLICLITIVAGCNGIQNITNTKLEFSSGPCDQTVSYNLSALGVKETFWLNNNTLQIKAYVKINCAADIKQGNFEIRDDKIILKYASTRCNPCTSCECTHELTYKLTDLDKKDYEFELKEEWNILS